MDNTEVQRVVIEATEGDIRNRSHESIVPDTYGNCFHQVVENSEGFSHNEILLIRQTSLSLMV